MDPPKASSKTNPRNCEGLLSKLTFGFMNDLCYRDDDIPWRIEDCFQPHESERVEVASACLQREWAEEVKKDKAGNKANLRFAMARAFWFQYAISFIFNILEDTCRFLQPFLLEILLGFFEQDSSIEKWKAFMLVAGIGCLDVVQGLIAPQKILRLPEQSLRELTTGHVFELVDNDASKFGWLIWHLHDIWRVPFHIAMSGYFVYRQIGWPVLSGFLVLAFALPLQAAILSSYDKAERILGEKTDERVSMMSEVISGMKVIKMYCWEKPFGKIIDALRLSELSIISKRRKLDSLLGETSRFNEGLLKSVIMIAYILTQTEGVTASKIFPMFAVLDIVSDSVLERAPEALKCWLEVSVSAERIQRFLLLPEMSTSTRMSRDSDGDTQNESHESGESHEDGGVPQIYINNFTAKYESKPCIQELLMVGESDSDSGSGSDSGSDSGSESDSDLEKSTMVLDGIDLDITGNKLLAIVGPVGCGKSSLLMALLGELESSSGSIDVTGSMSYSAQEPWLFPSTIRSNILFGREYDAERYGKVLEAAALLKDLEQLPHRDKTLVAEKGITLSGGQKARISLARALYADADIMLLDDPLSAVDAEVGLFLYQKCINGYLKDKLRVLVTHQTQFLKDADQVIVLNKAGRIEGSGTYEELIAEGIQFLDIKADKCKTSIHATDVKNDEGDNEELRVFNQQESDSDSEEEEDEDDPRPQITWKSYFDFFTAGSSHGLLSMVLVFSVTAQFTSNLSDWWMAYWLELEEENEPDDEIELTSAWGYNIQTFIPQDTCLVSEISDDTWFIGTHLGIVIYLGLIIVGVSITFTRSLLYSKVTMASSRVLHDKMYTAVMRAPARFFDSNPTGTILGRFDMDATDAEVPDMVMEVTEEILSLAGDVVIVMFLNTWTLVPILPIAYVMFKLFTKHHKLNKKMENCKGEASSPALDHLTSTIDGVCTIRAFGMEDQCVKNFEAHYDARIGSWATGTYLQAWFTLRQDLLTAIFNAFALFVVTFYSGSMTAAECGLALSYITPIMSSVDSVVGSIAGLGEVMVTAAHVLSYTKLQSEASLTSSNPPLESWPQKGTIEFRNVNFKYHDTAPIVLKNIDLKIEGGTKVGIVGRTGAGKSSIVQCLFRMAEPEGEVVIDGITTSSLGLHELRSKISIIPQDPVLFIGTVKYNLDPCEHHTDAELWKVLKEVRLKELIRELDGGLNASVEEGGCNFSVGEKQLFCLARAILKTNKILVIDEATANVDKKTDEWIQQTLHKKFKTCTVLTIAHRLETIMDSDKILVMSDGRVEEYDNPDILLQNAASHFSKLVKSSTYVSRKK